MKTTDIDMSLWCLVTDETTAETWRREVDDRADRGTELASTIVLWARAVGYDIADDATVASVRLALADLATDARDEWAAECEVMP